MMPFAKHTTAVKELWFCLIITERKIKLPKMNVSKERASFAECQTLYINFSVRQDSATVATQQS